MYKLLFINTSMGQCKKDVTPVYQQWSNFFFALTHRYHSIHLAMGSMVMIWTCILFIYINILLLLSMHRYGWRSNNLHTVGPGNVNDRYNTTTSATMVSCFVAQCLITPYFVKQISYIWRPALSTKMINFCYSTVFNNTIFCKASQYINTCQQSQWVFIIALNNTLFCKTNQ